MMRPPILYLDLKRLPGNFHQGLVHPVKPCLLGQDPRGVRRRRTVIFIVARKCCNHRHARAPRGYLPLISAIRQGKSNKWARKYRYLGIMSKKSLPPRLLFALHFDLFVLSRRHALAPPKKTIEKTRPCPTGEDYREGTLPHRRRLALETNPDLESSGSEKHT